LVAKTTFSAVAGSDLLAQLRARNFDTAMVAGLTTPICVQTTVDGLSMGGVKVVLLEDACASQAIGRFSAEEAHQAAVDRMGYAFGPGGRRTSRKFDAESAKRTGSNASANSGATARDSAAAVRAASPEELAVLSERSHSSGGLIQDAQITPPDAPMLIKLFTYW
jgi:hypothetical protein